LTKCPELSFGIFSRPTLSQASHAAAPVKAKLIAHIIATRTPAPAVTDASMGLPSDWEARRSSLPRPGEEEPIGHQEEGRTIALHSLAVAVEHQKKGLGTVLMKAYIQRIKDSKIADRIAVLSHDHLVGFYEHLGFTNMGPSACVFGGGEWSNMVRPLTVQASNSHDFLLTNKIDPGI
jgi:GNAT superfamily N-acetyltransferase